MEVWESFTWELTEVEEHDGVVVALLQSTGKARGSGLELDRRAAMVWRVDGGTARSLTFYEIRRRRSPRRVRLRKSLVGIRDGLPAHGAAIFDGPDVCEPRIHFNSACAATATLVNDRNQPVVALDHLLRYDTEAIEALEPASEETLEAVASVMRPRFGAVARFMPLDLGIEQL